MKGRDLSLCATLVVASGFVLLSAGGQQEGGRPVDAPRDYDVAVVHDVMVSMRDGVKLATDVYIPARNGQALTGPWPAVLERTPYGKERSYGNAPDGPFYARKGYVMVVQDVRGRFGSEGVFGSYNQEADDGLDTFRWVTSQPWSNQKVAVTGSSYFGVTAQAILTQAPPGLAAAVIRVTPGNYHEDGAWRGGAFLLSHNVNYTLSLAANGKETAQPAVKRAFEAVQRRENAYIQMLLSPMRAGASPLSLTPSYEAWYQDWQNHERYDAYWKKNGNSFSDHYAQAADVPVLLIGEWYDAFLGGMLDGFAAYSRGRKSPAHLILGPGEHGSVYSLSTSAGDVDFGASSPIQVRAEMMKWFDHHLKGADRGLSPASLVRAFRIEGGSGAKNAAGKLQAGGSWQEFAAWPPPDARPTKYFLRGDLSLGTEQPAAGSIAYTYDPTNPVPSIGGRVSSGAPVQHGPYDQRCDKTLPQCTNSLPLRARPDVLSFTTPPLARDTEVTGPVSVQLWISSSAVDTDFTAKLIDQYPPTADYPDGYAMLLEDSIVRARLRSFSQAGPGFRRIYGLGEELLTPGRVYDVTIDLWGISNLFRAGHRIRLDISSSSFPHFDVNPNTGEPFAARRLPPVVARNTIHVGANHSSHIVLPVR